MGSPPDVANIPDSLWEKVRSNVEARTAAALLLLFVAGSSRMVDEFEYEPDTESTAKRAKDYSTKRAAKLADSLTTTLRDRLDTSARDMRERIDAARKAADKIAKRPSAPDESGGGKGPASRARTDDAGVPRIPTREEIEEELGGVVDDSAKVQGESAGVTETTGANTAGEVDYARQVTKAGGVMTATWRTEGDNNVCPVCKPLNWTDEKDWPEEQRSGPPAHPNCRCFIVWHLVTAPEPSEN